MGEELGWDATRIEREVALYRARVEAELESQRQPDDESADRIRRQAPEFSPN